MAGAPEIVLASSNAGKLREFVELLASAPVRLRIATPEELAALPQEGNQYEPNARAKALAVAEASGLPTLADDSGLEVEALGGAPGPLSARYGGEQLDDAGRVAFLLAALAERPGAPRRARFVCVAALAWPDGSVQVQRGECPGRILPAPRGTRGFGYDPIFEPAGQVVSMAELPAAKKNELSHRSRALAGLAPLLAGLI